MIKQSHTSSPSIVHKYATFQSFISFPKLEHDLLIKKWNEYLELLRGYIKDRVAITYQYKFTTHLLGISHSWGTIVNPNA